MEIIGDSANIWTIMDPTDQTTYVLLTPEFLERIQHIENSLKKIETKLLDRESIFE